LIGVIGFLIAYVVAMEVGGVVLGFSAGLVAALTAKYPE
jgi:hypothetical protein